MITVLVYIGVLLMLFVVAVPVGPALGITALIASILRDGFSSIQHNMVAQRMMYGINNFSLLAVPFFLLAGRLMNIGGVTQRIFDFAGTLVRHFRGGLAHVNIIASLIFSGMSGSATSDAAGLGTVEMEAMLKEGYDKDFSAAVTAASSTIGPIIPPSLPMVIYGVLSGVSIGKLFLGGIIPGLLMTCALMIVTAVIAGRRNYPKMRRASLKEIGISFIKVLPPLFTPVIIIGGIYSGAFTATEAAIIAASYALLLGCFLYKEIKFKDIPGIFYSVMVDTGIIFFITSCAFVYAYFLMRSRIPIILAEQILSITRNPILVLLLINVLLLVIGCFLETIAALTILTPVLVPLIQQVGIDPLHFGVVVVLNLMIGLLTPPFGVVLFVLSKISSISIERLSRVIFPFLIPLLIVLLLISFFPPLVMMIPNMMN